MGRRVVHFASGTRPQAFTRDRGGILVFRDVTTLACGTDVLGQDKQHTQQGQYVTCKSCRHTRAWIKARNKTASLYDEVLRVLLRTRYDWGRNRERIANLFGGPMYPRPHVLVALDRYEETDPADRDPAALAMELAPVEPGWLS
jgi:DNA-directed RNA polymerase subunit RPC12/RpoP